MNAESQQRVAAKEGDAPEALRDQSKRDPLQASSAREPTAEVPSLGTEMRQDLLEGNMGAESAKDAEDRASADSRAAEDSQGGSKQTTILGKRMLRSGSSDSGQNISTSGQASLKLARSFSQDSPRRKSERARNPKKEFSLLNSD